MKTQAIQVRFKEIVNQLDALIFLLLPVFNYSAQPVQWFMSKNDWKMEQLLIYYLCPVHVIFEVLKLLSNLESLFSYNFQLKKSFDQTSHFGTPSSY